MTTPVAKTWPWIEDFVRAADNSSVDLESVHTREQSADTIRSIVAEAVLLNEPTDLQCKAVLQLLCACRVFMRDRRGIDSLLSAETLDNFLQLAEDKRWSSHAREEALKCIVNSVYSRPEFVTAKFITMGFATRLLALANREGSASTHWLIWKILLVACESPVVPQFLCNSAEAWKLIYLTLSYGFYYGNQADIVENDRSTLLLDLIKLLTVLVNDMKWTAEQEQLQPEIFQSIHQLGGLLLEILQFTHLQISPLNATLIELKNKTMEVFMFLPGSLLAAFIQQQCTHENEGNDGKSLLSPVLDHLHSILLVVRVEKTRPLNEMLPTLIVCHNLAKTGDLQVLACFKGAILPHETSSQPISTDRTKEFFFKHLKLFLTCLDTDVRRYTSEWLFLLCDENAKNYTHHTGVGNAIGLLRMKGLA